MGGGQLEDVDPDAVAEARAAYRCFEPYGEDAQEYARALRMVPETCEDEMVEMLTRLREQVAAYDHNRDDYFNAEQYYREMVRGEVDSWNIRDSAYGRDAGALAGASRVGQQGHHLGTQHPRR